ncbi:MAG: orotate phosphoribosyltransferase [Acidimicrobiia bacterium]
MSRQALIDHLRSHALFKDGPYTLRSGVKSDWYLDARQTTFSGDGAPLVGAAVLDILDPEVRAVGGMTMGADPIALAVAVVAHGRGRKVNAFSVRKTTKLHGTGGRIVGPVTAGMPVAILEDTTTTGGAALEAAEAATAAGLRVVQAIALVDRSDGRAADAFDEQSIPYVGLIRPQDLGIRR